MNAYKRHGFRRNPVNLIAFDNIRGTCIWWLGRAANDRQSFQTLHSHPDAMALAKFHSREIEPLPA